MRTARFLHAIEILEIRIAPSSLNIVGGVLTYTATPGSLNTIFISLESANGGTNNQLVFSDSENITLGSGAQAAGFIFAPGVNFSVRGPLSAFNSFSLDLGDGADQLIVQRLTKPLSADTGAGVDTATLRNLSGDTPFSVNGALSVKAESILLDEVINGATTVSFTADNLDLGQAVNATGSITVVPLTPGREIDLGTENGSRLSLTAAETSRLVAPNINFADTNSGAIFSTAAVSFGSASVSLKPGTGNGVTQSGGAITAGGLVVDSSATVTLTGANNVTTFAARVTNSGANLEFTDATGFEIGSGGGIAGIVTTGGTISLNAGTVTQATDANLIGTNLNLSGAGPFTLTNAGNDIAVLSANITGALSYTDATALSITLVQTSDANIALTADNLVIGAAINAGTATVTLAPLGSATAINLGGADAAGTLGLSDTELDFITASTLAIGTPGATGAVTVSAAISPANSGELEISGGAVGGAGTLAVAALTFNTTGAVTLPGANDVDTLTLLAGSPIGASSFADADGFRLGHPFNVSGTQITTFDVGTATVLLGGSTFVFFDIEGATPGSGHDQIVVNGTVNIVGTTLTAFSGTSVPAGAEFVIISNDGVDAVTGTFAGLDEGDVIPGFSPEATITYEGGDGNDVAIITVDPITPGIGAKGRSLFFTDVDGDFVTITTTKGTFTGNEVSGVITGPDNAGRFEKLTLGAGFAGANITITAKPGANGGNGFVNLGFLDATGVDLGAVTIAGDLARLVAGTLGGDAKVPALKSLTVQSLGLFGESTLARADQGVGIGLDLLGALPKLTVKDDLRASIEITDTDGKLGTATIGGSFVGFEDIFASAGIGLLKIVGDIRAVGGTISIGTTGAIGGVTVDGSIVGESAVNNVLIGGYGQLIAPTKGNDVAIKNVTVKGSIENTVVTAGFGGLPNADASIGSISVGGDWIASAAVAGVEAGPDMQLGTADDAKFSVGGTRDHADIVSIIGSFTVKGQALGTAGTTTDMFGIVAEQIGKAKVGGRTFAFTKTGAEAFFAAPTLDGEGTENPMFDFTIREIGAATPVPAFGGANLTISTDGRTATFVDVDGDNVTVKRNVGVFGIGDFVVAPAASGGGLLQQLTVTPAPNNAATNLTISAKPGVGGGNGFVNVGEIEADQTDLGTVSIAGELQDLDAGDNNDTRAGIASLTVQSLGAVAGTAPNGDEINSAHGIGKITVKTDVRDFHIFANNQDSGNLGTLTVGGSMVSSEVQASANIGTIKIGGSFRDDGRIQATDRIGAVTIGGDLIGTTIEAFAQSAGPTKGLDVVLKSLSVNGSVEATNIILGRNNNADASIGALSASHAWIASSVLAGVTAGADTFIGTADDEKVTAGGPIDMVGRFATISSIIIKGQALGTSAVGDSFGIVAEQIVKAKVGGRTLAFAAATKEAFSAAPTSPGASVLPFDFFIREVTV